MSRQAIGIFYVFWPNNWRTEWSWKLKLFYKKVTFWIIWLHFLFFYLIRMKIWLTLCVTWLCPSIGLTFLDIFFDSLLAIEYYAQWRNVTYVNKSIERFVLIIDVKHFHQSLLDVLSAERFSKVLNSTPPDLQFIVLSIALPLKLD